MITEQDVANAKAEADALQQKARDASGLYDALSLAFATQQAERSGLVIGEAVKLVTPDYGTQLGILGGFVFEYGSVRPVVFEIKKDGTASKFKHFVFRNSKLEPAK